MIQTTYLIKKSYHFIFNQRKSFLLVFNQIIPHNQPRKGFPFLGKETQKRLKILSFWEKSSFFCFFFRCSWILLVWIVPFLSEVDISPNYWLKRQKPVLIMANQMAKFQNSSLASCEMPYHHRVWRAHVSKSFCSQWKWWTWWLKHLGTLQIACFIVLTGIFLRNSILQ